MNINPQPEVAIVIPALNEASTIVNIARQSLRYSQHVIIVDDASSDGTTRMLSDLPVTVLRHDENQGKGASLVTGFGEALRRRVSAVITLDGDGQHRPEDIPKFLFQAKQEPNKIIIGTRLADTAEFPTARHNGIRIADFWISWASGYPIEDSQCGFRLYPRNVIETVKARHHREHGFVFESEILINAAHAGFRTAGVSIPALYDSVIRRGSHFRPYSDVTRIVIMVALKLLPRFMYPLGLYNVIREWRHAST